MNIMLRRQGLGLESLRNIIDKMETRSSIFRIDLGNRLPNHDYAFNWGNTSVGYTFTNLINKPSAVIEISNKGKFRKLLYTNELTMFTSNDISVVKDAVSHGKKLLIRPANHMGGNNIHVITEQNEVLTAIRACGSGWYASEYIPKVKEFRVFISQGRVVYVVEKIVDNPSAIAWNVHQGGRFINVNYDNWNLRVVKSAVEAFCLTELDFGAVDVIVDNENKAYVLEINSAPAMTSEYWTTCVAKAFDYIVRNGSVRIPLITDRGGYKKFIHPAINGEAIIPDRVATPTPERNWYPNILPTPEPVQAPTTPDVTFNYEIRFNPTVKITVPITYPRGARATKEAFMRAAKTQQRERLMTYLREGGFIE